MQSNAPKDQRTPLGQGEGCECEWVDDAKAYDWTACPIHAEAEQAAYGAWLKKMARRDNRARA